MHAPRLRDLVLALLLACAACVPGAVEGGAAPGDGCTKSAQCPASFFCVEGACQMVPPQTCKADRDCFPDMVCSSGQCVDGTSSGNDGGVTTPPDNDGGTTTPPDTDGGTTTPPGTDGGTDAGPVVGVTNGDFEGGALTGWNTAGVTAAFAGGHTGSYAAQVGSANPSTDSAITQQVLLPPGSAQLSFWYKSVCHDALDFDWGTATVLDTSGNLLATSLPKTCTLTDTWVHVTKDLSTWAGQNVVLSFANHDDNMSGDTTYTLYDDIQVGSSSPDFTLAGSPASVSGPGSATINAAALNGFSGSIVLSVSGAPSGASASLSTTSISASGSATLTLSPGTAAGGTYAVRVTGTSGALSHAATVSWTIAGAATPDFTMSASPTSVSASGSATVTVSAVNGFSSAVALSVSGAPSGSTASLSTSSISGSGSSTLSLNPGSAAAGTYTVRVTGTSGSLSHSATVSWTVPAPVCTTDTWSNYAHSFFSNNCYGCHSWANSYSGVQSRAGDCQSRISSGDMPQGRTLSSTDKQRILKWLGCGLPQ